MKKTLLFIAVIAFVEMSFAQIETRTGLQLINRGDTVVSGVASPDYAQFPLSFTNTSTTDSRSLIVYVDESSTTMASGMTLAGMCADGECLPGLNSPAFIVGKDSTYNDFHLNISVDENVQAGTFSLIKINVIDAENTDDTVNAFYLKAEVNPVSINEALAASISICPNPAGNMVRISFEGNADRMQLVNMLGSVVRETVVESNAGGHMVSVAGLNSGVYACILISKGKAVASKRLIVK